MLFPIFSGTLKGCTHNDTSVPVISFFSSKKSVKPRYNCDFFFLLKGKVEFQRQKMREKVEKKWLIMMITVNPNFGKAGTRCHSSEECRQRNQAVAFISEHYKTEDGKSLLEVLQLLCWCHRACLSTVSHR